MFSTFTGSSRRPRNVNLSGQTNNPFANTSWSPSVVSNTTKTVSDAQADRERRQAERERVKAAAKIQRIWRGHQARNILHNSQRAEFDHIYQLSEVDHRPRRAIGLLVSFFTCRRDDDIRRLLLFAQDAGTVEISHVTPPGSSYRTLKRLAWVLLQASELSLSEECVLSVPVNGIPGSRSKLQADESVRDVHPSVQLLLKLLLRVISASYHAILPHVNEYYTALAKFCQKAESKEEWVNLMLDALRVTMATESEDRRVFYQACAFSFLTQPNLRLVEENVELFSKVISSTDLAEAIINGYSGASISQKPQSSLLWLLAHSVDLGRSKSKSSREFGYLESLYTQLAALSSDISIRLGIKTANGASDNDSIGESLVQPLDPYVARVLMHLVESHGISQLLHDFSETLAQSSQQEFQGTSLLAGYILTLLRCFPSNGDDIRMRLFLEQIPMSSGTAPIVIYLWRIMKQTSVFRKLQTESEKPVDTLRRYLQGTANMPSDSIEEQEWRIILLFLELYIFILRLSDDEDFFSAIRPKVLASNTSTSRIRSCSLPLEDLKALTAFLKNTAFTLYYRAQALSETLGAREAATKSRVDSYFGNGTSSHAANGLNFSTCPTIATTRLDLESLRGIVTTAMKLLYERDSREQFLPANHWLMPDAMNREDFIKAVIEEEERQNEQDSDDSDVEMDSPGDEYDAETGFYFSIAGQRLSRHARLERLRAQQVRAMKERRLAEMGPKLEILKHMPFVIPFETRLKIFHEFMHNEWNRRMQAINGPNEFLQPYARQHARIRRDHVFEDAYTELYPIGDNLKDPVQITFVDQFGNTEAGIDGGGVTKEFLTRVTSEAFGDGEGGSAYFKSSEKGLLYPNPTAVDTVRESLRREGFQETDAEWKWAMTDLIKRYEFLGRIIGKCLVENILLNVSFANFFLLKWTSGGPNDQNGYKGSVNDLRDMDEELYEGMLKLKHYEGDLSELGFDFTISDQISPPGESVKTITRKLIPNGDQVHVTNDNRLLYISYVARHRLVTQPSLQTSAFLRGLRTMVRPSWLSMFNQLELQRLVGGVASAIDIDDLRQNTVYSGLYEIGDDGEEHPTIKLFWKVMRGFTDSERRDVLKYVSSTPRAPLLGFAALKPKFSIRDGGSDEERLPSTSTCVNLLKLPLYRTEATLRQKLLYAIQSGAGFDLS